MTPAAIVVQGRRYVLDGLVGAGAFGEVFRARREDDGLLVAIKRLKMPGPGGSAGELPYPVAPEQADELPPARDRMLREARVLARIESPYVVRHLEHRPDAEGQLCLVLEWLDGEDLARRQRTAPLTLAESIEVVRQFALGLEPLHRAGVVHRDVKPSNMFLLAGPPGAPLEVKVIDLGIAAVPEETALTAEGQMIGTTAYMSPEQVRGDPLTLGSDLFSLGVVLYELVSGDLPFAADEGFAVLAKILLTEPRRLTEVAPKVPTELDDLVMRCLSKPLARRPASAAEVAEVLGAVGGALAPSPAEEAPTEVDQDDGPTEVLSASAMRARMEPAGPHSLERRVVTAIFARWPPGGSSLPDPEDSMGRFEAHVCDLGGAPVRASARGVIALFGLERTIGDEAARAAEAALEAASAPGVRLAIATGRTLAGARGLSGDAIEWGAAELDRARGAIHVDEATARLLPPQFATVPIDRPESVEPIGVALRLQRAAVSLAPPGPRFFGRETPTVGRDRELRTLDAISAESRTERVARGVLVTGPAGSGKSRLRYEFLRRLAQAAPETSVLFGRADSLRAGSPFGLLAEALRSAAGIFAGEALELRRQKLSARVGRHLPPAAAARVSAFLGEIVSAPFPDDAIAGLAAARADPRLMGDRIRAAWEEWLDAECSAAPTVLVLEDLHWGDRPTVALVDGALRNLRDRPLMMLALARPEVTGIFPGLWAERTIEQISIDRLTPKASRRLFHEVLGDEMPEATVALVVDRADGNPFYLEELMRAVAAGAFDELPDTVLGMVQARLDALGAEAKRVLRAASVFGERFWLGGVAAIVQGTVPADARRCLDELCDKEVISRRGTSRFPGESEYVFRHALVREAAYAMLADADRALAHRSAGSWLDAQGETDAIALAEHFARGGAARDAVAWFLRGAEQALEGNDLEAAIARADRGIQAGADGEVLGALLLAQAEAHLWRGELGDTERCSARCAAEMPHGRPLWLRAVKQLILVLGRQARYDEVEAWVERALAASVPEADPGKLLCLCHGAEAVLMAGRAERADQMIAEVGALAGDLARTDASTAAQVHRLRALRAIHASDLGAAVAGLRDSLAAFERAGDARNACSARLNTGYALAQLGSFAEAESALRQALAGAERMGLKHVVGFANHNLGWVLARRGMLDEARALEQDACLTGRLQGDPRLEAVSRIYLSAIERMAGRLEEAEREALRALGLMPKTPTIRVGALAALAGARLAQGRVAEALEASREGIALLEKGGVEEGESASRLLLIEALLRSGLRDEARQVARTARQRLDERAARIGDPGWRESFLARVPEHARTLELAAELL